MTRRAAEILLIEDDLELAEMITHCLEDTGDARVTAAESAADALREELTARHDVMIASMSLPDGAGLGAVRELRSRNRCPLILTAEHPTVDDAIDALRLGAADLLLKPFDMTDLINVVEEAIERGTRQRERRQRYRRLRRLSAKIVRERRDLRQRMDLICRDLVHAYRGLAQKVADSGILSHEVVD